MNPGESLLLLGCGAASSWLLVKAAFRSAQITITAALADLTTADVETHHWTLDDVISHRPISADENAWETEADEHSRPLRDTEKVILRDWQDMPYDIDADGGN